VPRLAAREREGEHALGLLGDVSSHAASTSVSRSSSKPKYSARRVRTSPLRRRRTRARAAEARVAAQQVGRQVVPSIDARGMPKRSAKKRSVPATAPQLPHTLVLLTRASSPHAVSPSSTRSNGM
jgi:hypothetical protein